MFRPAIVEEGHHKRKLATLTGIDAEENQARRLLDAMRGYGMFLTEEAGRPLPEAVVAYRWLTERYEPTIASVPERQRGKLVDAEIYHQVLDHLWFLSEKAGRDIGLADATADIADVEIAVCPPSIYLEAVAAAIRDHGTFKTAFI